MSHDERECQVQQRRAEPEAVRQCPSSAHGGGRLSITRLPLMPQFRFGPPLQACLPDFYFLVEKGIGSHHGHWGGGSQQKEPLVGNGASALVMTLGVTGVDMAITRAVVPRAPRIFFTAGSPFEIWAAVLICRTERLIAEIRRFVLRSEFGTAMVLMSAAEDLAVRTLARFQSPWSRLRYLAGTRTREGYAHWGLERVHGPEAAKEALRAAHTTAWIETLRTPIRELAEEESSRPEEDRGSYLPEQPDGGSVRHFNSIVFAIEALARSESHRQVA